MKSAHISDYHLDNFTATGEPWHGSLNTRAKLCLETLDRFLGECESLEVAWVIFTGDLCNRATMNSQMQARVRRIFARRTARGMRIAIIPGNHDQTTVLSMDNANAVFHGPDEGVYVFDSPSVIPDTNILVIPFRTGEPAKWLPGVLEKFKGRTDTLVLHCGLSTDRTPHWLAGMSGAVKGSALQRMCEKVGINRVSMGDWHYCEKWCPKKSNNGFEAYQVGTACPSSFSDAYRGVGRLMVLDHDTRAVEMVTIPGPRFIKIADDDSKWSTKYKVEIGDAVELFLQVTCMREDYEKVRADALAAIQEVNPVLDEAKIHFVPEFRRPKVVRDKAKVVLRAVSDARSVEQVAVEWAESNRGEASPEVARKAAAKLVQVMQEHR